jgi:predicted DNA-binding protein
MSNTLTVRLPEDLVQQLREKARRTGLPMGRIVRQSIEATLAGDKSNRLLEFAGVIKGGPRDLSSRKGFSRK